MAMSGPCWYARDAKDEMCRMDQGRNVRSKMDHPLRDAPGTRQPPSHVDVGVSSAVGEGRRGS